MKRYNAALAEVDVGRKKKRKDKARKAREAEAPPEVAAPTPEATAEVPAPAPVVEAPAAAVPVADPVAAAPPGELAAYEPQGREGEAWGAPSLRWAGALLVAIVAMLTYLGSLDGPFLFDDAPVLTANRELQGGDLTGLILRNPSRALTNLTFYANFKASGLGETWPYHLVSLLLHGLNAALVSLLVSGLLTSPRFRVGSPEAMAPEARWPGVIGALAGLLFAAHPAHSMAVAYIAQRYALMSASALLLTLLLYDRYRRLREAGQGARALAWLLGALAMSLSCYITKENTAIVGLLIVAIELAFWRGEALGSALIFVVPFVFAIFARGTLIGPAAFEPGHSKALLVGLAALTSGGLAGLLTYGQRFLPEGTPGLTKGPDGAPQLATTTWLAGLIAAGGLLLVALGLALTLPAESRLMPLANIIMLLTALLVGARVATLKSPGLLPLPAFAAFLGGAGFLYLSVGVEDTYNTLFPAPEVYRYDPVWRYFLTQTRAVLYYLRLMALPWGYTAEHAYEPARLDPETLEAVLGGRELLALLGHLLMGVLALRLWSWARMLSFAILWFYISLLITSSVIPILDPLVEQRMYLPLALGCAALVVAIARLASLAVRLRGEAAPLAAGFWRRLCDGPQELPRRAAPPGLIVALVVPLVALLAWRSQERVWVWGQEERVWEDAIAKSPHCARAYSSLGMVRLNLASQARQEGDERRSTQLVLRAIADIEAALQIGVAHVEGWNNLGKAYLELDSAPEDLARLRPEVRQGLFDRLAKAESCFVNGLQVGELWKQQRGSYGKAVPLCHNNLGLVYRRLAQRFLPPVQVPGRPDEVVKWLDEAATSLREASAIDPGYLPAKRNLCALLLERSGFEADARARIGIARQALEVIIEVCQSPRASIAAFDKLLASYIACGQGDLALQQLKRWDREGPEDDGLLADIALRHGREAGLRVQQLQRLRPEAQLSTNELDAALLLLREALRLGVGAQEAATWILVGELELLAHRPNKVEAAWRRALEVGVEPPVAFDLERRLRTLSGG